jgi:hypothetical protein
VAEDTGSPGRVLVLAYGFFTLASGSRSIVQIGFHLHRAPTAYVLSGVAAVVYGLNTVVVARSERTGEGSAARALFVLELVGVLGVGTLSLVRSSWFADASVWSGFGRGYGFVPLALPLLGLLWLRRTRRVP